MINYSYIRFSYIKVETYAAGETVLLYIAIAIALLYSEIIMLEYLLPNVASSCHRNFTDVLARSIDSCRWL